MAPPSLTTTNPAATKRQLSPTVNSGSQSHAEQQTAHSAMLSKAATTKDSLKLLAMVYIFIDPVATRSVREPMNWIYLIFTNNFNLELMRWIETFKTQSGFKELQPLSTLHICIFCWYFEDNLLLKVLNTFWWLWKHCSRLEQTQIEHRATPPTSVLCSVVHIYNYYIHFKWIMKTNKRDGELQKIFLFRIFTMGLNLPLEGIIHYVNIGNIKYCGGACEGTAQLKSTSQNVSTFHMIIELHGFSNRIWSSPR